MGGRQCGDLGTRPVCLSLCLALPVPDLNPQVTLRCLEEACCSSRFAVSKGLSPSHLARSPACGHGRSSTYPREERGWGGGGGWAWRHQCSWASRATSSKSLSSLRGRDPAPGARRGRSWSARPSTSPRRAAAHLLRETVGAQEPLQ